MQLGKEPLPEGYSLKDGIAWGYRVPGLLEIKYHSPKTKNALTGYGQKQVAELLTAVNKDEKIKCVLFHGGRFYSAGNDLSALTGYVTSTPEEARKAADENVMGNMVTMLTAVKNCEKPIVACVRGGAHGIGFTKLALMDFIYVTEDANFKTPFI